MLEQFEASIQKMSSNDQNFARDLLRQWVKRGNLSDKQMYWVDKLMKRVTELAAPVAAAVKIEGAGMSRIRKMFDTAAARLKYPKIWLGTEASPLRLSLAGENSKHRGSIMVTDGRPFGSNNYYGAIDQQGVLKPGRDLTPAVVAELTALATNPEAHAAQFGRMTGCCCFCNTPLKDPRSVSVGYGPVCAENFGLEWGSKQGAQS